MGSPADLVNGRLQRLRGPKLKDMSCPSLLPDPSLIHVDYLSATDDGVTLVAAVVQAQPRCPECRHPAQRVHSRYSRTLADQPWKSLQVRLRLRTRRWFCDRPDCSRQIFTERLPGLVQRYAHRTDRLARILGRLGMALGGEAGARLAAELGLPVSPDTLLRQVQQAGSFSGPGPRVLGVDDFAFRRGHQYGTILVDLERGEPVDLLPDRRAETLAEWLKEHPGVEIISRDRGAAYAEGARQGAPTAQQIADRWHLLKNLVEALETTVAQDERSFAATCTSGGGSGPPSATASEADESQAASSPATAPTSSSATATPTESTPGETRRRQLYEEVQRLQRLGWSKQAIARELGQPQRTVQRFAQAAVFPARQRRTRPPGQLAPYRSYLEQRLKEGCRNAAQLWRELQNQGFTGSYSAVHAWIAERHPPGAPGAPGAGGASDPQALSRLPTPRTVTWWLLRPADQLHRTQVTFLHELRERCPVLQQAQELVQEFFRMARERQGAALEAWVTHASASGIASLCSFAEGLRRDWEAVVAGLTLPWSNGPVEGQVNRLKLIKRQMYGRASFPLLRARVLQSG